MYEYIYIFEYSASFIMLGSREPYGILCVAGVGILVKKFTYSVFRDWSACVDTPILPVTRAL